MITKPATTDQPIHALLRDRWSPRAFDSRPIPEDQVLSLLEAARWSPSGGNGQPWSFIVVPRDDAATFERLTGTLNEGNLVWAQNAPLLIVAVARTVRDNGAPNAYALYDLGQAVAHLSVQASALGLSVHQMGGFSQDAVRDAFGIPADHTPATVIAVGWLGDHDALPEGLREREQAPRTRKPLESFVYGAHWGEPAAVVDHHAISAD
jgi:nitroreductase